MKRLRLTSYLGLCSLLVLSACSFSSVSGTSLEFDDGLPAFFPEGSESVSGDSGNTAQRDAVEQEPELEIEATFRAPVVTGRYVWSANPESGRVAVIDAETFEVRSVEAGLQPTDVAALDSDENTARALVLNRGSFDATLLSMDAAGEFTTITVPTHGGADNWSVQGQGKFAIAWTNSANATRSDPTDGFQDITVIDVNDPESPKAVRLTVGYRPSAFYFNAAGTRAYAITQDGISVVELETGMIRLSRLLSLPQSSAGLPDVTVLPDGSQALARIAGESQIYVIDLEAGTTTSLQLSSVLTDLDVSADGTMAVAVIRRGQQEVPVVVVGDAGIDAGGAVNVGLADAGVVADAAVAVEEARMEGYSEAVFIPVPAGLNDASLWESVRSTQEIFGSVAVSPDATQAVLYTTVGSAGRVVLVNEAREVRTVELFAQLRAVFITPDGSHAVALQQPVPSSVRKGAFSVISLTDRRAPKRVASDAPTIAVALGANSQRALVSVSDPSTGNFGAYLIRMPSLQVDFSDLPSRPLSTGTVSSAGKAFVAQEHPEGRLTFFDFESGDSRDITGFELSAKVVNE